MQAFDPAMYPHRAYLKPLSESSDRAGSVVESFTPSGPAVPCRVRLKETRSGFAGQGEIGVTLADVAFPVNPGVAKGWRIQRASDSLLLRCLGSAKDRAQGFNFVVACEVIE